ncbi:MAG: UvrD-helicase domain-containing protein [Candidatus Hydrogenedentes bacterium]|nr:UvrD-helicase domain-containing protein [Candidatus Hydrogenedentota bacterium]
METLNEAQRNAVTAPDGPALVLAGAGSGKTRVIVERMRWLIREQGHDPRSILALTFTNKAASEMRRRVTEQLEGERAVPWVGTFHSFGLYVLRRDADRLGRSKTFTIFDDGDQLSLMKRLIKELPSTLAKVSPRDALQWLSLLKQELRTPDADEIENAEDATFHHLWSVYHATLQRISAVDFDDLLVLTARLLEEVPEVRDRYRARFRYVLVDEYQDTNHAQYRIARSLSGEAGNIFVVGDEDQSIYSWRGANIRNILDFESDFPGARIFRLEQNYRSTRPILAVANAVVAENTHRLGKTLWSDRESTEEVSLYWAQDGNEEAAYIADTIAKREVPANEIAVLYRTKGQSRLVEEALLKRDIPYVVVGGIRFYARKEIKDLLCYLRVIANPHDEESIRRVLNVPPRGIGAVALARLKDLASRGGIPLLQALHEASEDESFGPRLRTALAGFYDLVTGLGARLEKESVEEIVNEVLAHTGYREYVQKSDEKDFRARLEYIEEFLSSCGNFDSRKEGGVVDFLQELSLVSDTDDWDTTLPMVALMTLHSAKGLEFEQVFLIGLEEGYLPHASAFDSEDELEEERRLCYVGMTRARSRLMLTAARTRTVYGDCSDRELSRFLPLDRVRRVDTGPKPDRPKPGSLPGAKEVGALKMGVRIRHAKFGRGTVMFTSGAGAKLKVRIRFDSGMSRQFMAAAAPLEIEKGRARES